MPEILLKNMRGDDALLFRSACGLIHVLSELPRWAASTLRWEGTFAVLGAPGDLEDLVADLDNVYATRVDDPRWSWASRGRGTREEYRAAIAVHQDHAGRLAWIRGTGTDQVDVTKSGEPCTAGSSFDSKQGGSYKSIFTVAWTSMRSMAERPSRADVILDALLHGELVEVVDHHLNWLPQQPRGGAWAGKRLEMIHKTCQPFVLALAVESLALFPVNGRGGRRARTAGFTADGQAFSWGLWSRPVDRDSLQMILDHPALHDDEIKQDDLRALGFHAAFRSRRFTPDKEVMWTHPLPLLARTGRGT